MKKGVSKNKGKNLKKSYIYTLLKISLIVLALLIIAWALLFILEKTCDKDDVEIEESGSLGTLGIFGTDPETSVYFPDDCTDTELKASWDSIFKESSTGTTIISNKDATDMCENFVVYKIDGNIVKIIKGEILDQNYRFVKFIAAYHGNFTDDSVNLVSTYISSSTINNSVVNQFFLDLEQGEGVQGLRDVVSTSDAKNNFSSIFKIESNVWTFDSGDKVYGFQNNGSGIVYKEENIDLFYHAVNVLKPINLTQILDIPNFVLNESRGYLKILNLSDYFENPGSGDSSLEWSYKFSPEDSFSIEPNSQFLTNRNLDFNASKLVGGNFRVNITLTYPGEFDVASNTFDINVSGCYDTDGGIDSSSAGTAQNLTLYYADNCTGDHTLVEFSCRGADVMGNNLNCNGSDLCYHGKCVSNGSVNHAPGSYGLQKCLNPKWNKDKNYTIDGNKCFFDMDDDSLTFRYEEINLTSNENLSKSDNLTFSWVDESNLTLTSDENWIGTGSFRFFASDSRNESRMTINFKVFNVSDEEELIEIFEIISPNPASLEVFMVIGEEKNFSIGNTDYDSIKWYIDDVLIRTGSRQFRVEDLELGNHTIKVELKKEDSMDLRSWKVYISEEEPFIEKIARAGDVIFYIIIFIVLVVILLIIWAFLAEKNREKQKKRYGFGVSNVKVIGEPKKV